MNTQTAVPSAGYQAAISRSAYYIWENPGFLRIGGADRQAFLQRQTTNDLGILKPDGCLVTVLTNPAARILDVLTVLSVNEDLLVVTLPGRGEATQRYLRSRIFFNDKVTLTDASHGMALIDLLGQQSADLLTSLGIEHVPEENVVSSGTIAGEAVRCFVQHGQGYRLACQGSQAPALLVALDQAGASRLSYETFNLLRIEAGIPASGQELTDEYTPLEAGLDWAISGSKGCYTGQEVIARQITYDKVTRHLAGLRLVQPALEGEAVFSPDEDHKVGTITSAAVSPRLGSIALAILHRPFNQPGTQVVVGKKNGPSATVASLPF